MVSYKALWRSSTDRGVQRAPHDRIPLARWLLQTRDRLMATSFRLRKKFLSQNAGCSNDSDLIAVSLEGRA